MANRWWKIEVQCNPEQEESIFYRLEALGCRGTATEVQEACVIRAYLPQLETKVSELESLAKQLREDALALELAPAKTDWHLIDEEDWASSWKQHWQPTPVGDRFLVCPAWLSPPGQERDRIVIRLDPGAAFGTGTHPTTQLCLEALEHCLASHTNLTTIADIGCGSGILSLGAILAGVKQGYAVDIDPLAVSAASSNRQINQITATQLAIAQGSIEQLQNMVREGADGILCNILAEVIIKLIPQMGAITKPSTWGILSGILNEQAAAVTDTLEQHGWKVAKTRHQQKWCCLEIQRT